MTNTTFEGARPVRRLLVAAGAVAFVLIAGAACGSKSQSSSPVSGAAATNVQAAQAAPGDGTRTTPSAAQLADVIAQVKARIPMSFQPSEGHARAFGDAACTAFDQGKSAAQVKELVLQSASQLQAIKVSSADADFAVRAAVNLFCPGYSSRLGS